MLGPAPCACHRRSGKALTQRFRHLKQGVAYRLQQLLLNQEIGDSPGLLGGGHPQAANVRQADPSVIWLPQGQGEHIGLLPVQIGANGLAEVLHGLGDQELIE